MLFKVKAEGHGGVVAAVFLVALLVNAAFYAGIGFAIYVLLQWLGGQL